MKKKAFLLLVLHLCLVLSLSAQSRMDLQLLKLSRSMRTEAKGIGGKPKESTLISVLAILAPDAVLPREDFESLGIRIGTQVGRVVSLRVPLGSLQELSLHPAVESLNASRRHKVTCFNTRSESGVSQLHD